jgi:hypothetical protein
MTQTVTARRGVRAVVLLGGLAVLTACGSFGGAGNHPCTLISTPRGISVDIAPGLAQRVARTALTVCWDGTCHAPALRLGRTPSTRGRGFAMVPDLPVRPVRVELAFRDTKGMTLLDGTVTVTPKRTYPNGRDCPASGPQAQVTVTADGHLRAHQGVSDK